MSTPYQSIFALSDRKYFIDFDRCRIPGPAPLYALSIS